jgi:hypothetical protein
MKSSANRAPNFFKVWENRSFWGGFLFLQHVETIGLSFDDHLFSLFRAVFAIFPSGAMGLPQPFRL